MLCYVLYCIKSLAFTGTVIGWGDFTHVEITKPSQVRVDLRPYGTNDAGSGAGVACPSW